jgi:tetratricopeptide (TPR) repeat protein
VSASLYEQESDFLTALNYRKQISIIDPFNALNYLAMGRIYKVTGNEEEKNMMLEKILSFAPNTPEAEIAKTELL